MGPGGLVGVFEPFSWSCSGVPSDTAFVSRWLCSETRGGDGRGFWGLSKEHTTCPNEHT